jgi:putative ABC transport system substrate-binding protein
VSTRIGRREFITLLGGAVVTWPLVTRAQQPERVRRIGALMPAGMDDADALERLSAFQGALEQLGWAEGRNVRIERRWGTSDAATMRKNAQELVALTPDVILANGSASMGPLLEVTRTVPIVFVTVADPVGAGYVNSLARPVGTLPDLSFTNLG